MSQEKPNRRFNKLVDHILKQKQREKKQIEFKDYYEYVEAVNSDGFKIEVDETLLEEATRATVGRFTAHRNQPHFAGDDTTVTATLAAGARSRGPHLENGVIHRNFRRVFRKTPRPLSRKF